MKWTAIVVAVITLSGCQQQAAEPSSVGKYQVVTSVAPAGTVLLNTETGQTYILAPMATATGDQLVWGEIKMLP